MDQLKEILKQAIKYRFWIAVGISALLPMVAYFMGVGAVKEAAAKETAAIKSAESEVKQYATQPVPNNQYAPLVEGKTSELTGDVNQSWKMLYGRQAPLLTWPKRVGDQFTKWGRQWPKDVDSSKVQFTIIDYVNAYPEFVTDVYKSFKPFDPAEGTGIVSSPGEEALLHPSKFSPEQGALPPLGKVWAAQERLWIQRTLLEVVAEVNKGAKDWNSAAIKQVNVLDVGTATAQDQRSIAKGEVLEEAPAIDDPAKPADAEASTGGEAVTSAMAGPNAGGGAAAATETVSYIKNESTQFKILPVHMSVLIELSRVPDFLVALENSPMTVQVMDFEQAKPGTRVTKPEKGSSMNFGGYGNMMAMYGGQRGMMGGIAGYGGRANMMGMQMNNAMMNMGNMGGPTAPERKGVSKRTEDRGKKAADAVAAAKKTGGTSLHDPYYDVVEVKIWGQARFFNPPPEDAPAESSQAEAATPKGEDEAAKKDEPKADAEKKPEGDAEKKDAPKDEAAKKDEPKAEAEKKDEPKTEAAKKDEPKADAEKKDEPKADAEKKPEAPKAEAPMPDDAKKPDAAKGDATPAAPK